MPSTSKSQFRAMQAAKAGKSTLGIPKKVGKEFVAADKGKSKADLAKLPLRRGAAKPSK
jgi:hypothetical protein